MVKKNGLTIIVSSVILISVMLLTACQKYYWDYECDWVSESPLIVLRRGGCGNGYMIIDGIEYQFNTWQSNDAKEITFCDENNNVIWQADTTLKKDKLFLTVTIDNISNYQGKTIELTQRKEN